MLGLLVVVMLRCSEFTLGVRKQTNIAHNVAIRTRWSLRKSPCQSERSCVLRSIIYDQEAHFTAAE